MSCFATKKYENSIKKRKKSNISNLAVLADRSIFAIFADDGVLAFVRCLILFALLLGLNKLNLTPSICGLNFFNLDNFLGEVILCLIIPFSKYEVETNGYYPHFPLLASQQLSLYWLRIMKNNKKMKNNNKNFIPDCDNGFYFSIYISILLSV